MWLEKYKQCQGVATLEMYDVFNGHRNAQVWWEQLGQLRRQCSCNTVEMYDSSGYYN